MPKTIRVAGIVLRDKDGRYLLVQEGQGPAYGLWNFPAGHIDEGETPEQAALREGFEETGFRVRLIKSEPILIDDTEENVTKYAFLAKIIAGQLTIPKDELLDVQWLSKDAIKQLNENGKLRSPWILNSILESEKIYDTQN